MPYSIEEYLNKFDATFNKKAGDLCEYSNLRRWIKRNSLHLSVPNNPRKEFNAKDFDYIERFEAVIERIVTIISNPRTYIKVYKDVKKAEIVTKIDASDIAATLKVSAYWKNISGRQLPYKLYADTFETEYAIYENKFVVTLIDKMIKFINKRTNELSLKIGRITKNFYSLYIDLDDSNKFDPYSVVPTRERQSKILQKKIQDVEALLTKSDNPYIPYLQRLLVIRRTLNNLRGTSFYRTVKKAGTLAENAIHPTNMLVGEKSYFECYLFNKYLNELNTSNKVEKITNKNAYRNYVLCCLFRELENLGFSFGDKRIKVINGLMELKNFTGTRGQIDVFLTTSGNHIDIEFKLRQRDVYVTRKDYVKARLSNKASLTLMPTLDGRNTSATSTLNDVVDRRINYQIRKGNASSFVVTTSDETYLDGVIICSPFTEKFDTNIYNMLKSMLIFIQGDKEIYSQMCPVCGSLITGEGEDGNFVCDYCESVYSILPLQAISKGLYTVWIKKLKTPTIIEYKHTNKFIKEDDEFDVEIPETEEEEN